MPSPRPLPERDPFPAPSLHVEVAARTDRGRQRASNEDGLLVADLGTGERHLFDVRARWEARTGAWAAAVCDGMGGEAGGEVASRLAAVILSLELRRRAPFRTRGDAARALCESVLVASRTIHELAREPTLRKMGTTATVAVLADRELVVGQVGDSRAYVFRHGVLSQVTRDQTLVALLLREGKLDADRVEDFPGGHIILQAVGSAPTVDVDVTSVALEDGDVLLLCSDGLSGPVPDAVISGILSRQEPVTALADALVAEANARGGPDNVTCVLARFTRA